MLRINSAGPEGGADTLNSVGCAKTKVQCTDDTLRFLHSSVETWGKKYVLDSLSQMSWKMSTTFSGMGCFESAALSEPRLSKCGFAEFVLSS